MVKISRIKLISLLIILLLTLIISGIFVVNRTNRDIIYLENQLNAISLHTIYEGTIEIRKKTDWDLMLIIEGYSNYINKIFEPILNNKDRLPITNELKLRPEEIEKLWHKVMFESNSIFLIKNNKVINHRYLSKEFRIRNNKNTIVVTNNIDRIYYKVIKRDNAFELELYTNK